MSTCNGNHNLIKIISQRHSYGEDEVVRWCQKCGAIVVDVDCDNRVYPGRIMKMRLPEKEKTV